MKDVYLKFKTYYANQKKADSWDSLSSSEQTEGEILINLLRDEIWFHKPWGFCGRKQNLTFVAPYTTGTIEGTGGKHVIDGTSTAWPTHVEGIPLRNQFILIGSKLYKIMDRISTTKLILDSPLVADIAAGSAYTIYFLEYPLRWDVGAIRDVIRDTDPITGRPESIIIPTNTEGESDVWYPAGQSEEAFETGTGTFTNGSRTVSSVGTITPADHHIGMAVTPESVWDVYYIVDFDAGSSTFTLDRAYSGATLTAQNLILNPVGTPLIGFRDYPGSREIVRILYTKEPSKMRGDYDLSGLPNDVPLYRAIKVVVTQWDAVGERGYINEVLFQDKKFVASLKLLQMRGTPSNLRMYTLHDLHSKFRRYRDTNPWNQNR